MCLVPKDIKFKKSKRNITVYVMRKIVNKKICSPFRNECKWKLNKLKILRQEIKNHTLLPEVTEGVFHSFVNKKDAIKHYNKFRIISISYTKIKSYRVFEAIIPKNTQYVRGWWEEKGTEKVIGSKRLKLIKEIKKGK